MHAVAHEIHVGGRKIHFCAHENEYHFRLLHPSRGITHVKKESKSSMYGLSTQNVCSWHQGWFESFFKGVSRECPSKFDFVQVILSCIWTFPQYNAILNTILYWPISLFRCAKSNDPSNRDCFCFLFTQHFKLGISLKVLLLFIICLQNEILLMDVGTRGHWGHMPPKILQ